ncbi:MAG TPA: glycerol-3-phosphate dehydrogenase [Thermomicrobiales bacterium]|nr:glycerol-3-phosphate dehydrogenase [Thermomicrobiales bacterium]
MKTDDENRFDLIVIGAGINGAGITREAALAGLRVLLLEKDDLSSATTATSSRLIHGGLRYLEYYEFPLVRESLRERERLLSAAPHLVHPLPLTLPIYKGHSRGPFMIRLGMIAYDVLSYDKSLPRHQMFTKSEALQQEPGLAAQDLEAAARYYDAQAEYPERLVVENVLDAVANGAEVRTHTEVTGFEMEAGVVKGVIYEDRETGEQGTAWAPLTINVSGPWVDDVLADLTGVQKPPRLVGGTKGSHIVVEPFPGAPKDALYIEARQDGRPYFIIPWNDLYLIGTTDIRFDGDRDHIVASEDEIEYLLTETNLAIPDAKLERDDVLYTFSGVRPLPYKEEGSAGSITRKHIIKDHAPQIEGMLSIIGGKLTTYRGLAEETIDVAFGKLGRTAPKSKTRKAPLPGAERDFPAFVEQFVRNRPEWLSEESARWLLRVYGGRSREIVALAEQDASLRQPLVDGKPGIAAVIPFSFEQEYAKTLADVLLRRTMLALQPDAGLDVVDAAARIAAESQGWDEERMQREIQGFRDEIAEQLPREMMHQGGVTA